jgi:hypothetical protein
MRRDEDEDFPVFGCLEVVDILLLLAVAGGCLITLRILLD